MRTRAVALIGLVALLIAAPAFAARSDTKSYSIGTLPMVSPQVVVGSGYPAVGGNFFSGYESQQPNRVAVADRSGGPVAFIVCQDLDRDSICGNRGYTSTPDPRVAVCGTSADLTASKTAFARSTLTKVFVLETDPDCPNVAQGGTITLHHS